MRFLVVDDSRAMQSIIKRSLHDAGYKDCEIKTASDGEQALNIIREWKPDLVLTDWYMPVMNGMELMEKIRREMLDIKIGFITTEVSEQRIAAAKEAGALFVIQKPFKPEDLSRVIVPALEGQGGMEKSVASADNGSIDPASSDSSDRKRFVLPSASSFAKLVNGLTQDEVLVESVDPISVDQKQLPCLVGLFDDGQSTTIRAVCVLELRAACLLGGAIAGLPAENVRDAIEKKLVEGTILEGCTQLLELVSAAIYDISNASDLQLRSVNVVPRIFPRLESIYKLSENGRSDFEVAVLGYGQGLMTIITA